MFNIQCINQQSLFVSSDEDSNQGTLLCIFNEQFNFEVEAFHDLITQQ